MREWVGFLFVGVRQKQVGCRALVDQLDQSDMFGLANLVGG